MKKDIEDFLIIIVYVIMTLGLLLCSLESINSPWFSLFISFLLIASFTLKSLFLYPIENSFIMKNCLILLDFILVLLLSFNPTISSYRLFLYTIMYQLVFYYKKTFYLLMALLFYFVSAYINYINLPAKTMPDYFKLEFYNFITYVMVFLIIVLLKHISDMNKNLSEAKNSISIKNLELQNAYDNIKEAYKRNEDYAVIKERNKMARDIHDTIGHTLTTALVELEACKVISEEDSDSALLKMDSAISQVRKGLFEVRSSVKSLNETRIVDYKNAVLELINNTISHTGVIIRHDIDIFEIEPENIKATIYRALQEGLTNGIKHGHSTAFLVKIKYEEATLKFSLEDNGTGCSQLKKGFGIKSMEERVKEVHGSIKIESEPDEGFNIYISFKRETVI